MIFVEKSKPFDSFTVKFTFSVFIAQTSCNQGLGRVMYERLPDQQLQGFDDDVVSSWTVVTNITLEVESQENGEWSSFMVLRLFYWRLSEGE